MYRAGIVLCLVCFFAFGNSYSATAINLETGVVDNQRYGNKHPNPFIRITDELQASFVLEGNGPTYLSVVGYDIDFTDEVSITLDGGSIVFLEAVKVNNGYSPAVQVDLGDLSSGNHTLVIKNAINSNYKWGVTDLLITQEDEDGGGGSGHAFELLTELGCEVGQIIRATALGWECVDEYSCPSYFAGMINQAMESDPVGGGFVFDGCEIFSDSFVLYFETIGEGQLPPIPYIDVQAADGESYSADFIRRGEFYACLKLAVDDAGNDFCEY